MNLDRARRLVSWNEVRREEGEFVFMRRGTGETGWWHDHGDGDYGGNPMDRQTKGHILMCRTCGRVWLPPNHEEEVRGNN